MNRLPSATPDTTLAEKGRAYYTKHLKSVLEPAYTGHFVAIEPDSGQYFVGKNTIQTMQQARAALPDKQFYLVRIGYGYAHKLGSVDISFITCH